MRLDLDFIASPSWADRVPVEVDGTSTLPTTISRE